MSGVSKLAHGRVTEVCSSGQRRLWMSKCRCVAGEISAKRQDQTPTRASEGGPGKA